MPIVQNIARKQGKVNPHPYKRTASPAPFGPRGSAGANVGNVTNPGNPSYLTAAGVDYNSRLTKTGNGTINPVGNHSDTATQLYVPPLVSNGTVDVVPQSQAVDVGPHEKGKFFQQAPDKLRSMRVSGGVDPNSNTPFHPKTVKVTRQPRYPQNPGERASGDSNAVTGLTSTGTMTGLGQAHSTKQVPRWSVIKRGAAEAPVAHHGTLASPTGGRKVGSGTTGVTATGGNTPNGRAPHVIDNAHSGSPFVVAWVPNARGSQPNEKGTTFPLKQQCS